MAIHRNNIMGILLSEYGVDLSKYDKRFFDKLVEKRIAETQCGNESNYCALLKQDLSEVQKLTFTFTVAYSEFFRDSLTFSVLERIVFPRLISNKATSKNKEIRIWSAACAGGQEAYSLAMLLTEQLEVKNPNVVFRIFATDSSPDQVQLAQAGIYPKAALSNMSLTRLNQWFVKKGQMHAIKDEVKQNIDFSVFDLFNFNYHCPPSSIFGEFDIVFCANILFYYMGEYQKKIIEKINYSLSDNGLFITGETERELLLQEGFEEAFPFSSIFLKKKSPARHDKYKYKTSDCI